MSFSFVRSPLVSFLAASSFALVACASESDAPVAGESTILPSAGPASGPAPVAQAAATAESAPPATGEATVSEPTAAVAIDEASRSAETTASDVGLPEEAPPPAPTAPPQSVVAKTLSAYRGVNLSGAEFGSTLPGKFGIDYTFATAAEVDYYMAKGANTFRIPFMWERLQGKAYAALDATYLAKLDALVVYATGKGAKVVLNPQNFARYYGKVVGSAEVPNAVFADFWTKVAAKYKGNSNVLFNLVNEPHDISTEQWVSAANAAIVGIRSAGATNAIIVPGNNWTGAYSWYSTFYGTANAVALLKIADSKNNVMFEVHQYLDSDSSGKSDQCVSATVGSERLAPFVKWLRANGKKGFLGEMAGGRNANCYAAVTDMLGYATANSDVLVGWLWWGAGPWWGETYPFSLDAISGKDRPQMSVLAPFLK